MGYRKLGQTGLGVYAFGCGASSLGFVIHIKPVTDGQWLSGWPKYDQKVRS